MSLVQSNPSESHAVASGCGWQPSQQRSFVVQAQLVLPLLALFVFALASALVATPASGRRSTAPLSIVAVVGALELWRSLVVSDCDPLAFVPETEGNTQPP